MQVRILEIILLRTLYSPVGCKSFIVDTCFTLGMRVILIWLIPLKSLPVEKKPSLHHKPLPYNIPIGLKKCFIKPSSPRALNGCIAKVALLISALEMGAVRQAFID